MNIKGRLDKLERRAGRPGDDLITAYFGACPGDWDDPPTRAGWGWRFFESEAELAAWQAARLGLDAGRGV